MLPAVTNDKFETASKLTAYTVTPISFKISGYSSNSELKYGNEIETGRLFHRLWFTFKKKKPALI